jgi:hypothetical protein
MSRKYRILAIAVVTMPLLATAGCSTSNAILQTIQLALQIVSTWL